MYRLFFLRWFPQKWRNSEMAKVISETVKLISEDLKPTFWIHITDFCTIYIIKWYWLILKYQISTEKRSKEAKKHFQIVKTELYKAKLHFKIVKTHFKNTKTHFGKAKTHFDGILLWCPWLDFGQKSLGYEINMYACCRDFCPLQPYVNNFCIQILWELFWWLDKLVTREMSLASCSQVTWHNVPNAHAPKDW